MNAQQQHDYEVTSAFAAEHPAEFEWIGKGVAEGNEFARSLLNGLTRYGSLTPRQLAAVQRNINKPKAVSIEGEGLTELVKTFTKAKDSGLKKPALIVGPFKVSVAPEHGRNAGYLYVKHHGEYAGKIAPTGVFSPAYGVAQDVVDGLAAIGNDPLAEAVKHGKETGQCACCGRQLTDPESVARGIGPICAEKWF